MKSKNDIFSSFNFDFVESQRNSFSTFLENGIIREFVKRNPITDLMQGLELIFYPKNYKLVVPKISPKQALLHSKTYESQLYIPVQFIDKQNKKIKLEWILLGNIPLMTKRGHFIINGSPRVIVHQMVRSPGIYLQQKIVGVKEQKSVYYADLIPFRGAWIRLEIDKKGNFWMRMKKTQKIPLVVLLQAIGLNFYTIFNSLEYSEKLKRYVNGDYTWQGNYYLDGYSEPILAKNKNHALTIISSIVYPKKPSSSRTQEMGHKFLSRKFMSSRSYDLDEVGRTRLNSRLGLQIGLNQHTLTPQDLLSSTNELIKLSLGVASQDDIDDLKNRRVRTSGELLQNQLGTALSRLEKVIRERMKKPKDPLTIRGLITTKALNGAFREFFGSSPLSQYMDQTNPLSEITHKRRLSSLGPGGITRETAGMAVRGIHPTHYGRICPIETPEGQNAGLVNSLTTYSRINKYGFLETPLFLVFQGQVQVNQGPIFFSSDEEKKVNVAPADVMLSYSNFLSKNGIPIRNDREFQRVEKNRVQFIAISSTQMISVATALIPFLEHDDANRALMGSNMQRQAVSLMTPEKPLVMTGLEARIIADSGQIVQAKKSGFISYISASSIFLESNSSNKLETSLSINLNKKAKFDIQKKKLIKSHKTHENVSGNFFFTSRQENLKQGFEKASVKETLLVKNKKLSRFFVNQFLNYRNTEEIIESKKYKKNLSKVHKAEKINIFKYGLYKNITNQTPLQKYIIGFSEKLRYQHKKFLQFKKINFFFLNNRKLNFFNLNQRTLIQKIKKKSVIEAFGGIKNIFFSQKKDILLNEQPNPCVTSLPYVNNNDEASLNSFFAQISPRKLKKLVANKKNDKIQTFSSNRLNISLFFLGAKKNKKSNLLQKPDLETFHNSLDNYERSNQDTFLKQRPSVFEGKWVEKGDLLADCASSVGGELALGKNILVAYMPWEGYNFEDAILINERLVTDEVYTSIHIERYEIEIKETKFGLEQITDRLPEVKALQKAHLDSNGIAKLGSFVKQGDLLVGKVTPIKKRRLSPHEKLLYDIVSKTIPNTKDTSLRVPKGVKGRVVHTKILEFEAVSLSVSSSSVKGKNKTGERLDFFPITKVKRKKAPFPYLISSHHKEFPVQNSKKNFGFERIKRTQQFANTNTFFLTRDLECKKYLPRGWYHLNHSSLTNTLSNFLNSTSNKLLIKPKKVHIFLAEKRNIQRGDKLAGRHGNKGIVSQILPSQDMPYLPDGTTIDMVLNPLGVPSRMNVGQIFESLLGLAGQYLYEQYKIGPFDEAYGPEASRALVYSKLYEASLKTQQPWIFNPEFPGKIKLFDGRSGIAFDQPVTVGKAYILKLVHLVDEKIHARSTGPYSLLTQQPLRGRSKQGGQRLGEMEVWALEGFGASYTLQELLTIKSDDTRGRHQLMDAFLDRKPLSWNASESFKVLLRELQSVCLNVGLYDIGWHETGPYDGISRKEIDLMKVLPK